jgi:hypothetical protein
MNAEPLLPASRGPSTSPMNPAESTPTPPSIPAPPTPQRLFVHEPGWNIGLKAGNERVFCYMMAPGHDYYHRLVDGELYLYHGDERLCLACAERRGLVAREPKGLRAPETLPDLEVRPSEPGSSFELLAGEAEDD